jgi:hypothetical protein
MLYKPKLVRFMYMKCRLPRGLLNSGKREIRGRKAFAEVQRSDWRFALPRDPILFMLLAFMSSRWLAALILAGSLAGCAQLQHTTTVTVSGGQPVKLTRVGDNFAQAENERFVVTESGLTTFRQGGRNFIRWQFTIRAKQAGNLARVRVEDVDGSQPVLILEDDAPELENTYWTKQSALIPANPQAVPWLYEAQPTLRVFRVLVVEGGGRQSLLYQPANFTKKAKDAIRYQMGPEIPGT